MAEKETKEQLSTSARNELIKQHYKIVGMHSAVKTCGWTKSVIRGNGGCYKLKFYGIQSHQCLQMSTSISCANRCTFCWRGYKAPVSKTWEWAYDSPEMIIEGSKLAHHDLIIGFKGSETAPKNIVEEAQTIRHVALSLTGEPILYPKINELIKKFHDQKISTFLVTNAQYPESIKDLAPITQLYISVDAPNKEILKKVDNPLFPDYWERLNQSLEYMAEKKDRTCIRLTIVKGINDVDLEGYKMLIEKGNPDFIEVKAYMYVGASQERLKRENMPDHAYIQEFTNKLIPHLPDYEIRDEHTASRVILLAHKKYHGKSTLIDFKKFFEENS